MLKKIIVIFTFIIPFLALCSGCSNIPDSAKEASITSKIPISSNVSNNKKDTSKNNESNDIIATIYTSDIDSENLINKKVTLKELTAESIFEELKNCDVVTKGTKLNKFESYIDSNNNSVGVINFSKEFYDFNLGSSFEVMMLDSIAKTYIENFNLDKLKILVDGQEYESGHILFQKDDYFMKESFN